MIIILFGQVVITNWKCTTNCYEIVSSLVTIHAGPRDSVVQRCRYMMRPAHDSVCSYNMYVVVGAHMNIYLIHQVHPPQPLAFRAVLERRMLC